jgi:hypothetical protein
MPATRTVQNPYASGQGFASVPVLFSLPNVQPSIAAASSGIASETTTGRQTKRDSQPEVAVTETTVAANNSPFESAPIVVSSTGSTANRTDAWLSKLTSQMTNITIVVLLVAVAGLAYQNQQQSQGKRPTPESDTLAQVAPAAPTSPPATATTPAEEPRDTIARNRVATEDSNENSDLPPSRTEKPSRELVTNKPPDIAFPESPKESLVVEKGAVPLLLPPAPSESVSSLPTIATGPYGTPVTNSAAVSGPISNGGISNGASANGAVPNPFSLTSSKVGLTQGGATSNGQSSQSSQSSQADRARWEAIDTETPSLNTRDIILLRNGQRRAESGNSDTGLPRVESVMRPQSGSRVISSSNAGTPVMTGQSYPPIAPQYEPISMPNSMPKSSPSRITQPSTDALQTPAQKQYIPLGAVLPNPNEANGFENRNP